MLCVDIAGTLQLGAEPLPPVMEDLIEDPDGDDLVAIAPLLCSSGTVMSQSSGTLLTVSAPSTG